jgi:LmbE family N-acetylglucosaminyl deacetylase
VYTKSWYPCKQHENQIDGGNRALQLTNINGIVRKYRHIFLSPHFDDVVYSCGGTLGVQVSSGLHPLVITVFGGPPPANTPLSPFAQHLHAQWGADPVKGASGVIETRRKEDAAALEYLQTDYLWLDYSDAIYRGNPAYYTSEREVIGGDVHPADEAIEKQLGQLILDLQSRLPDAAWYAPLGIGRHVDHQIVCSAADRLVQSGAKVYFYEDFPYVQREGALQKRIEELGASYEPNLVEVSEFLPARQEASKMYASQIITNFGSQEDLVQGIDRYTHGIRPVETVRLERYWVAR